MIAHDARFPQQVVRHQFCFVPTLIHQVVDVVTGLLAKQILDRLDRIVQLLGEFLQLAPLGFAQRVQHHLQTEFGLLLIVLGLGLLILLRFIRRFLLLLRDGLLLRCLRRLLHRLGRRLIALGHLLGGFL